MQSRRQPHLILASQSSARRRLLSSAGIPFSVEPSYFDETLIQDPDPVQLVKTLALAKAQTVAQQHPDSQMNPVVVIGADSILYLHGEIHGKPQDVEEAWQRWQQMRGQVGELYTGHALIDTAQGKSLCHYGLTRIYFAKPSDAEIRAYIATGEPLACAGCFAIDGYGSMLVERIEGCHTNVIGLSMPLLRHMLGELGYQVTDFWDLAKQASVT